MKNFDDLVTKDREFKVGGETLRWHDVRPEVLSAFELSGNGSDPEKDPSGVWKALDEQILVFLHPDDRAKWVALREREEDPVTIAQINAILLWLVEEQTGRPTVTPSPSDPGRGRTAASSKAG